MIESIKFGAYLSNLPFPTSLDIDGAHFDHSFWELKIEPNTKQPSHIPRIILHNSPRGRVAPQPLVGLENAIAISNVLEEANVEFQLTVFVESHSLRAIAGFWTECLQRLQERLGYARIRTPRYREVVESISKEQTVRLPYCMCSCIHVYDMNHMMDVEALH